MVSGGKQVQEFFLSELHPFKNQPFLIPSFARFGPEVGYEIVAGHHRNCVSELSERKTMSFLFKNLGKDEATIIMMESSVQWEKILPSEKA